MHGHRAQRVRQGPGRLAIRLAGAASARRRAAASLAVLSAIVLVSWSAGLNPFHDERHNAQAVSPTKGSAPVRVVAMTESKPVRIRIPSVGIDSTLMKLGLQRDGTLEVPPQAMPAGWFSHSPTPGELGPAVIAGHVAWNAERGVFFDLHRLSVGSKIFIDRKDGSTAVFRTVSRGKVDKDQFPTDAVYGNTDYAGLRLITCADFDPATGEYTGNFVAFAELVDAE